MKYTKYYQQSDYVMGILMLLEKTSLKNMARLLCPSKGLLKTEYYHLKILCNNCESKRLFVSLAEAKNKRCFCGRRWNSRKNKQIELSNAIEVTKFKDPRDSNNIIQNFKRNTLRYLQSEGFLKLKNDFLYINKKRFITKLYDRLLQKKLNQTKSYYLTSHESIQEINKILRQKNQNVSFNVPSDKELLSDFSMNIDKIPVGKIWSLIQCHYSFEISLLDNMDNLISMFASINGEDYAELGNLLNLTKKEVSALIDLSSLCSVLDIKTNPIAYWKRAKDDPPEKALITYLRG